MDAGGGMEAHQIIGDGYVEGENDNIIEVDDVEGENINDMGAEGDNDVCTKESDAESNVTEESNPPADVDFHSLADIWNEMTVGLESSRVHPFGQYRKNTVVGILRPEHDLAPLFRIQFLLTKTICWTSYRWYK